jgi:predicted nucleic acid-binding protein
VIVLDSSAVVDFLLRTPAGERIAERVAAQAGPVHAPELLDVEVVNALARLVRRGDIEESRAVMALEQFEMLPLRRYVHEPLVPRIWDLRHNLSAYDATYVALAEILACPLVTSDGPLSRSPGHGARVELF